MISALDEFISDINSKGYSRFIYRFDLAELFEYIHDEPFYYSNNKIEMLSELIIQQIKLNYEEFGIVVVSTRNDKLKEMTDDATVVAVGYDLIIDWSDQS